MIDTEEEMRIARKLRRLRARRRRAMVLLWGCLPGVLLVSALLSSLAHRELVFIVAAVWMALSLVASVQVMLERCPRCEHPDLSAHLWHGGRARVCPRCGQDLAPPGAAVRNAHPNTLSRRAP